MEDRNKYFDMGAGLGEVSKELFLALHSRKSRLAGRICTRRVRPFTPAISSSLPSLLILPEVLHEEQQADADNDNGDSQYTIHHVLLTPERRLREWSIFMRNR